jgi:hypothetical protein
MTQILLLSTALLIASTPADTFDVRATLQALYDEISQATLQFTVASDVDLFHDVLYTPDWVFLDAAGKKQTWAQVRAVAIDALSSPRPESMRQPIRSLSLEADGVSVVVALSTVRTIVDAEGRYGRQGGIHALTATTMFRDRWIRVADDWKMKSREQLGAATVSVSKSDSTW